VLPQHGTCWRTSRGSVALWTPAATLLIIVLRDHGDGELAAPVLETYRAMPREEQLHLFFDAEHMVNYDSALRTTLTAGLLPDRTRLAIIHVLAQSKMVAMGASVVNLALGGLLSVTNQRQVFCAALDRALLSQNARGFSSNVLESRPLARTGDA